MARQEIILGTAPTGLGGDPPRTASTKINAMTLELYTATNGLGTASKLNVTASQDPAYTTPQAITKQGDYGIGVPLSGRVLPTGGSNRADVLVRNTGFSVDLLTAGDKPSSFTEGPLVSFGYDTTQGFQMALDWRDGTIYTFPSAASAPTKDWVKQYHKGNVVGPISDGNIIERGINVNGEYIKFIDGTLICFGVKDKPGILITTPIGAFFNSPAQTLGAFASTFSSVPTIIISAVAGDASVWVGTPAVGAGEFYFFAPTAGTRNCAAVYTAIGRWK